MIIWKKKKKKAGASEEEKSDEQESVIPSNRDFYMCKSFLFRGDQVELVADWVTLFHSPLDLVSPSPVLGSGIAGVPSKQVTPHMAATHIAQALPQVKRLLRHNSARREPPTPLQTAFASPVPLNLPEKRALYCVFRSKKRRFLRFNTPKTLLRYAIFRFLRFLCTFLGCFYLSCTFSLVLSVWHFGHPDI